MENIKLPVEKYEEVLLATLGSIQAHRVLESTESSKSIRDLSKRLEGLGVDLRKHLINVDKLLKVLPDDKSV